MACHFMLEELTATTPMDHQGFEADMEETKGDACF